MVFKILNNLAESFSKSGLVWKDSWRFEELTYTPYLLSSFTLNNLMKEAKKQNNIAYVKYILHHIYRHQCQDIESYKHIANTGERYLQKMKVTV
jgi:hypothetical protein